MDFDVCVIRVTPTQKHVMRSGIPLAATLGLSCAGTWPSRAQTDLEMCEDPTELVFIPPAS